MPLNDEKFAKTLQGIFDGMWNTASNGPHDNTRYAKELAKAINDEIRNGDVQPGIPVSGAGATTAIGKIK